MISGSVINRLLLTGLLFICFTVQIARAGELESLMQLMASVQHRIVHYKEEKQMELLEIPLSSEGTLEYIAPNTLVRSVHRPSRVRYVINSRQVIIEKGEKSRTLNLDDLPLVRAFVESFRAMLAGDLTSLQAYYDIMFSGDRNQWQITLYPTDKSLAAYVEKLQLSGTGDSIRLYIIEDSNGDLTRMTLYPGEAVVGE